MSEQAVNTTKVLTPTEEEYRNYVYENRRYVGKKETIAYILFDFAQNFTINKYNERFIFDVVRIDFAFQAFTNFVGGIWDVVNDTIIGAIVDKTRTRWGKFKPYLVTLAIPGTIGTLLYWMLPIFFPNTSETHFMKLLTYFLLAVTRETIETFRGISVTGMLATISPHPVERTRLITLAHLLSIGDNIPEALMSLLIDGINNGILKFQMKSIYVTMGCFTTLVSGLFALYFSLVAKERIIQSEKGPSVMDGIKSILNNKPILLITLAEFLSSFSINTGMTNYYIDVLGSSSIYMIVGIPGGFVSTPSFALVP
ncbi:MAG TPA: MFS transporter, partial [Clostridiales bacterium]|nr:MFS transporter [Clostridiales bacterium]